MKKPLIILCVLFFAGIAEAQVTPYSPNYSSGIAIDNSWGWNYSYDYNFYWDKDCGNCIRPKPVSTKDKPQFKKIWTYENSSVTPYARPPMQEGDEYFVANDTPKWFSWLKDHPEWRQTSRGEDRDRNGQTWFYIEVCKGCPLPTVKQMPSNTTIKFKTPPGIQPVDSVTIKVEKPCHWIYKIIQEHYLETWLNQGWKFETAYTIESGSTNPFKQYEKINMVIIKRQVCP